MAVRTELRQDTPILLFNDECAVCRRIAKWVQRSASTTSGVSSIVERPIGDDPEALLALNEDLDIWDAYETIHLLMPDGSMMVGGEACAEVLRRLPNTKRFAGCFAVEIFGFRPFQWALDLGYDVLSDIRPAFGCESCGTPSVWLKPMAWTTNRISTHFGRARSTSPSRHFTPGGVRPFLDTGHSVSGGTGVLGVFAGTLPGNSIAMSIPKTNKETS